MTYSRACSIEHGRELRRRAARRDARADAAAAIRPTAASRATLAGIAAEADGQ